MSESEQDATDTRRGIFASRTPAGPSNESSEAASHYTVDYHPIHHDPLPSGGPGSAHPSSSSPDADVATHAAEQPDGHADRSHGAVRAEPPGDGVPLRQHEPEKKA